MTKCPKCSAGPVRIAGPHYKRDIYGFEKLWYRCGRCGYEECSPTDDANKETAKAIEALGAMRKRDDA